MVASQSFVGAMHAWPSALDARAVLAHKSRLLLQGDFLTASPDDRAARFLGRCLHRGASLWEQWLLEHAPASPDQDERRLVSALSLAERAGDWQLVDALLDPWGRRGLPKHRRFYRTMHARVAQEMPRWQQAMLARAALAAVAARRASQGGKGGDLTAALDALATVVLAATLAAAGDHAALVAVLEAATARLPTHDALRAMTKAARELGAAAARLEPQLEAEMVRESQRLLAA